MRKPHLWPGVASGRIARVKGGLARVGSRQSWEIVPWNLKRLSFDPQKGARTYWDGTLQTRFLTRPQSRLECFRRSSGPQKARDRPLDTARAAPLRVTCSSLYRVPFIAVLLSPV